jgi:hypothetical protein
MFSLSPIVSKVFVFNSASHCLLNEQLINNCTEFNVEIRIIYCVAILFYLLNITKVKKVKQSRYTPWRRLEGQEA